MRRQILTAKSGMEEIHEFCFKEFAAVCLFWNFFVLWYSCNITYPPKEVYAYCDNSMRQTDYIPVCSPAALICASDASAATSTS